MKKPIHILLAEDEPALGQIVKESLETRSFEVTLCENGERGLKAYQEKQPDILVLDIMMPKKDGLTLAKEIRLENKTIPIIFLTAKTQTADVLEGFASGGNDYIRKPFSIEELIARVHNLLNTSKNKNNTDSIKIGEYQFDAKKQLLTLKDQKIQLTHRESQLLHHLVQNKNAVLDRSEILKKLWGRDDFFTARSMDVFISKLRKHLKLDTQIQIVNVRGFGYKLIC